MLLLRLRHRAPPPLPSFNSQVLLPRRTLAAAAVKAPKPVSIPEPEKPPPTPASLAISAGSRRTGVLGLKAGMLRVYDQWARAVAVTVVKLESPLVLGGKTMERDGYTAVVVAAGPVKSHKMTVQVKGVFRAAEVEPRKHIREFRVSADALIKPGTPIDVRHFVPGQTVDVAGTTIGKGFQGAMKRWGFKGQSRTHGTSRTHRSMGGTGARQDPGKTWKGKKMHGHMGCKRRTVQNLKVFAVDPVRSLVLVEGHIPGHIGGLLELSDAIRQPKQFEKHRLDVPFPTFVGPPAAAKKEEEEEEKARTPLEDWAVKPKPFRDPLAPPPQ